MSFFIWIEYEATFTWYALRDSKRADPHRIDGAVPSPLEPQVGLPDFPVSGSEGLTTVPPLPASASTATTSNTSSLPVSGDIKLNPTLSLTSIELMMGRLMANSEGRMKTHIDSVMAKTISSQIQPLRAEIATERTEHAKDQSALRAEFQELRQEMHSRMDEVAKPSSSSASGSPQDYRSDEIVVGGFELKSRAGAISMTRRILDKIPGNPKILEEKVSATPQVVPVKFENDKFVKAFVESHGRDAKTSPGYFNKFWRNFSQSKESRDEYNQHFRHLFKVKRALLETTELKAENVVVKNNEKQVYVVDKIK